MSEIEQLVYSHSAGMEEKKMHRDLLNCFPPTVMQFDFDKQDYGIYEGKRSPDVDHEDERT